MSQVSQLLSLEKNNKVIIHTIIENIVRMLTNRNLLDKSNLDKNIEKITLMDPEDQIYKIELDEQYLYYPKNDDTKYLYVKLLMQKITGISKSSNIIDFLRKYEKNPKIIVATGITNSAETTIRSQYPYTEVFLDTQLMFDLVSNVTIPLHILLSEDESKKVLEEYLLKKVQMPKIFTSDPVNKYYNGKIGNMFKIIRNSETSGLSVYYRLVVPGNILSI